MEDGSGIKLVVGLGNPGPQYADTRHNVGAWFVEKLAQAHRQVLYRENKLLGLVARVDASGQLCWLFCPTTYMNESGQAIQSICQFYKILPQEIVVAHDELDLSAGTARLKERGGHGGHNGLRDTIRHLHTDTFYRLRIGINHPGHKDAVTPYVLSSPSARDKELILQAIDECLAIFPDLVAGDFQKVMRLLHGGKH